MKFETSGRTGAAAPVVLLSAGLGGLGAFWEPQLASLGAQFRVVTYDHRGTGANQEALPAKYSIDDMAGDVLDVVAQLGCRSVHFVGHALGGLVGLALAARAPTALRSLTVVNGWSTLLSHTKRCFQVRLEVLAGGGVPSYFRAQPIFLYPATWLEDNQVEVELEVAQGIRHFQGEENLMARVQALEAFEIAGSLQRLQTPTLVVGARDDVLVPVQASMRLAEDLPASSLHLMEGGHCCCRTEPSGFNAALSSFLTSAESALGT